MSDERDREISRIEKLTPNQFFGEVRDLVQEAREASDLEEACKELGLAPVEVTTGLDGKNYTHSDRDLVLMSISDLLMDWLSFEERARLAFWITPELAKDPGRPADQRKWDVGKFIQERVDSGDKVISAIAAATVQFDLSERTAWSCWKIWKRTSGARAVVQGLLQKPE